MKAKKAFQLNLQDKVLWVVADGFWTLATAEAYVKEFRALVKPIVAAPWAIVLDIRAWQVSPAEVFDLLVENTNWCYQHNLPEGSPQNFHSYNQLSACLITAQSH